MVSVSTENIAIVIIMAIRIIITIMPTIISITTVIMRYMVMTNAAGTRIKPP